MNFIKKYTSFIIAILVFMGVGFFFYTNQAMASSLLEQVGEKGDLAKGDLSTIIANFIKMILGFLGIILVIIILYAGFLWMTAGGESGQVDKAKDWIKNAIIGLVIIVLAYTIATFVTKKVSESVSGSSSGGYNIDYQILNILK